MPIAGKSLYFHVPFCLRKCPYCHFYSVYPTKERISLFVEALIKELKTLKIDPAQILSVYFGGGTPSLMGEEGLEKILHILNVKTGAEITLELNPINVTDSAIIFYKKIGINRISLGVQSFQDTDLKEIERLHSSQMAIDAILTIYRNEIKNISIDLMYDIPGQTKEHFESSLEIALKLPITHLSLYNLTIEENTPFYKKKQAILSRTMKNGESFKLLKSALFKLSKAGFKRYEISAFAKENLRSIHNIGYWTGREFIGLGPSAFSYQNGVRYKNVSNLDRYIQKIQQDQSPIDFKESLPLNKKIKELLAVQLRMIEGLDWDLFQRQNGKITKSLELEINLLVEEGFLEKTSRLKLTKKGLAFYDLVAERII